MGCNDVWWICKPEEILTGTSQLHLIRGTPLLIGKQVHYVTTFHFKEEGEPLQSFIQAPSLVFHGPGSPEPLGRKRGEKSVTADPESGPFPEAGWNRDKPLDTPWVTLLSRLDGEPPLWRGCPEKHPRRGRFVPEDPRRGR